MAPRLEGLELPDDKGIAASVLRLGSSLPAKDLDVAPRAGLRPRHPAEGARLDQGRPAADRAEGARDARARRAPRRGASARTWCASSRWSRCRPPSPSTARGSSRRRSGSRRPTASPGSRTTAPSRSRLDEQLAQAQRYGKKLALILCDIDHFKTVNDTYGHPVGDVVLRAVAKTLQKEARATDVVARYGGEEFAVVMPETDAARRGRHRRADPRAGEGAPVRHRAGQAARHDLARDRGGARRRARRSRSSSSGQTAASTTPSGTGRDRSVSASSLRTCSPARLGRAAGAANSSPEPHRP